MVHLLFFGPLADVAGRRRDAAAVTGETPQSLLARLAAEDCALAEALAKTRVKFALNDTIVPADVPLADGDVLAVLPPFSGG